MKIWNRIRFWSARTRLDRDLAAETRAHREMLAEHFEQEGMSPEEAHFAAWRRFGSDLSSREKSREEWGFRWLDAVLRDVRFALRMIRRQPVLTLTAVLTVGLGAGANTAVFSVLETVLLNPLGMRDANRVMAATVRLDKLHMTQAPTSGVEFLELKSMTDAFSEVAATEGREWTAAVNGEPARLVGGAVTPGFFRVFGQRPFAGRFFAAEDRESVVLSYRFWRARCGGDLTVLGHAIVLDGKPHRIVGIAQGSFQFPATAEAWTPLVISPERMAPQNRGNNMTLGVFVRLRDRVTSVQAIDRVNRYVASLQGADEAKLGYHIDLEPFARYVAGDLRRPLWILWTAALVLLLAGCANVAALLLSRAAGRKREMAIRLSLGASRFQIVRQLLIESFLLGALGGAFGVLIAGWSMSLLVRVSIPQRALLQQVALDHQLMLYALALALLSGITFGIAPAIQLLRESQAGAMARSAKRRFQDWFVTAEVAAALVLAVSTGLLLRSFWAVEQVRPGFDPKNVSTAYFVKPRNDPGFLGRLESRLSSSPGVRSAALAYPLPFSGGGLTSMFSIKGRQRQPGEPEGHGEAYFVSPSYFETLRMPIVRGRALAPSDSAGAPIVCVIDTRLAERYFPHEDPLGQAIAMYRGWARIVGVVRAIRATTLEQDSRPVVYYSLAQIPFFDQASALVRSSIPGGPLIRDAVRQANGSVPVFDIRTMEDRIAESLGVRRVVSALVCVFGVICLLLAAIGIHGVAAQVISERTREIGVRIALGARRGQILAQFLRSGLMSGFLGVLIGIGASAYAQSSLRSLLYGVQPFDIPTFAGASAAVMVILLFAVFWPARRASLVEPRTVLHYE